MPIFAIALLSAGIITLLHYDAAKPVTTKDKILIGTGLGLIIVGTFVGVLWPS